MTVDTQHVEIHVDCKNVIAGEQVKPSFKLLSLQLILEKVTPLLNEIDCIFELLLLCQDFDMKKYKRFIKLETRLFHKLEHKKVSNIEHFGLKFEIETDEIHTLYSPLSMGLLLVSLVKGQSLVLLLQQFPFSNV